MTSKADSLGAEALLQASSDCKLRLVRLLVDGGTLANVRNKKNETPLILACKSEIDEKEKVVEFLIKHRVKMNLQDIEGKTALMHACLTNSSDFLIRRLVNAKANPWIKDETNNTAFDYAINAGNIGAVKAMIQACREGKFLTKPGSFNIEMKRLEDRLDQMPEVRKCSWPLMGPRCGKSQEKKVSQDSELLAVDEDDENESSTRERRRKKSICHFDPIELEPDKSEAAAVGNNVDNLSKAVQKGSLYSVGRSSSEDERISLHFSDSDNSSSFDRSSATFSSLERLLKLRDSISSSVDSNESTTVHAPSVLQFGGAWKLETNKNEAALDYLTKEITSLDNHYEENKPKQYHRDSKENTSYKLNGSADIKKEAIDESQGDKKLFPGKIRKKSKSKGNEANPDGNTESSSLHSSSTQVTTSVTSRRKTVGSYAGPRKEDVMESLDSKSSENRRRVTVSTMEISSHFHTYTTGDLTETKSFSQAIDSSSQEIKLSRKKMRQPEVDLKMIVQSDSDATRTKTFKAVKNDFPRPINLIISKPEEIETQNEEGTKLPKANLTEKITVRRTLSDGICQSSRRGNFVVTRSDNHLSVNRNETNFLLDEPAHALSTTGLPAQVPIDYRERTVSSPIAPNIRNTPPFERKPFLTTPCDVIVTTTACNTAQDHETRCKSCDLPDLVLQSRARSRSPSNSMADQMQRLSRSSTPEVLNPISPGSQGYFLSESYSYFPVKTTSGSYTHLPEVVSGTTSSSNLKEKGTPFLPPLNISRKSNDAEEGYFSCSPSPMDLESPNRGKEKSRYSFKPLSPRLTNRSVRNLLP